MISSSRTIKSIAFISAVIILSLSAVYFTMAWAEPTLAPPDGNVAAPINVSATAQTKMGALSVSTLYDSNDPLGNYFVDPSGPVSATLAGNVGIGTPSPGARLDISALDSPDLRFYDSDWAGQLGRIYGRADGGAWTDARLTLQSIGGGGAYLDTLSLKNGNVGIGTTTPGVGTVAGTGSVLDIALDEIVVRDGSAEINFVDDTTTVGGVPTVGVYNNWRIGTGSTDYLGITAEPQDWNSGVGTKYVMTFRRSGRVGILTQTPSAMLNVGGEYNYEPEVISGDATMGEARLTLRSASNAATDNPVFIAKRSRGGLPPSDPPVVVAPGDDLWEGYAMGYDGSNYQGAGQILMSVDGAVAPGSVPGKIQFATTPVGGGAVQNRMTIKNDGNVGIGKTNPNQKLEINGGIKLNASAGKPACDFSARGTLWFTQSGAGIKDALEVCAKNSSDAYGWRLLW
jgi:hypothetical protein